MTADTPNSAGKKICQKKNERLSIGGFVFSFFIFFPFANRLYLHHTNHKILLGSKSLSMIYLNVSNPAREKDQVGTSWMRCTVKLARFSVAHACKTVE
jgi:hypothetical protein